MMKRNSLTTSQIRYFYNRTTCHYLAKIVNLNSSPLGTSSSQIASNFCWKCGSERVPSDIFCQRCNSLQNPQERSNYFKVLGIQEGFNIDLRVLRDKFRGFQSVIHPDKFSNSSREEQTISEEYSSLINKAYSSLQSPLKRAEHLLQLNGVSITENQTIDEPAFLMKIMELNEEIEEAENNVEKLKQFDQKNKNEIEKLAKEFSDHFQSRDMEAAKKAIIKMKYFYSMNNRIKSIFRETVTD